MRSSVHAHDFRLLTQLHSQQDFATPGNHRKQSTLGAICLRYASYERGRFKLGAAFEQKVGLAQR